MTQTTPTSFRLSDQAREMLAAMAEKLGLTAADTLELLIRKGHNEGIQGLVEAADPKWAPRVEYEKLRHERKSKPGPKKK